MEQFTWGEAMGEIAKQMPTFYNALAGALTRNGVQQRQQLW